MPTQVVQQPVGPVRAVVAGAVPLPGHRSGAPETALTARQPSGTRATLPDIATAPDPAIPAVSAVSAIQKVAPPPVVARPSTAATATSNMAQAIASKNSALYWGLGIAATLVVVVAVVAVAKSSSKPRRRRQR